MNQITENIACNSELYSHILDTSANNRRLYKVLDNIEKTIKHSMSPNLFTEPPEGGIIPVPKIDIDHIVKYLNINFFNEPFSVIITTKSKRCNSLILDVALTAEHKIIVNSTEYIENGNPMSVIKYNGWQVNIENRIPNFPDPGKDTITIVYTQDIFHFTFHSATSKYENGECISEEWENKTKGAFHMKLDCIRIKRRTNPETPLWDLSQNKQSYFPFVYDTSMNQFMTMGAIIGKTPNVYTSAKTRGDDNICHNEDALDIWHVLHNKRTFCFIDSSGITQSYILKVLDPMYNYIVKQINHSMTLPSEHALYLERPNIIENDPYPTPVDCTKKRILPGIIIRCKADPLYNEQFNNSNFEALQRLNEVNPGIIRKPGGNQRKTIRKKSVKNKSKRRGRVFHQI
jgi:hypothetical protein